MERRPVWESYQCSSVFYSTSNSFTDKMCQYSTAIKAELTRDFYFALLLAKSISRKRLVQAVSKEP